MSASDQGKVVDLLSEIDRDRTLAGRRALVMSAAELFFADGDLTDEERGLAIEALRRLIHEVEVSIRRALADRLAAEARAPRELILALADDTIEVAFPILRQSPLLQDRELIDIIQHRTLEHQLAIAMRSRVSGAVAAALVERGHLDVITTLLENPNAEIKA
jgi:uncharacterized protein (DUF2336 family)